MLNLVLGVSTSTLPGSQQGQQQGFRCSLPLVTWGCRWGRTQARESHTSSTGSCCSFRKHGPRGQPRHGNALSFPFYCTAARGHAPGQFEAQLPAEVEGFKAPECTAERSLDLKLSVSGKAGEGTRLSSQWLVADAEELQT